MVTCANVEFLCNIIYKHHLDLCNSVAPRSDIIDIFKNQFENVWFTLYDDFIVAVDISNEAFFISQLGVFRYKDLNSGSFLSLKDYLRKEHFSVSIIIDMYDDNTSPAYIADSLNYKLSPVFIVVDGRVEYSPDVKLSTETLRELNEKLSLYYSTLKIVQECFDVL